MKPFWLFSWLLSLALFSWPLSTHTYSQTNSLPPYDFAVHTYNDTYFISLRYIHIASYSGSIDSFYTEESELFKAIEDISLMDTMEAIAACSGKGR